MNALTQAREFHKATPLTGLSSPNWTAPARAAWSWRSKENLAFPSNSSAWAKKPEDLQPSTPNNSPTRCSRSEVVCRRAAIQVNSPHEDGPWKRRAIFWWMLPVNGVAVLLDLSAYERLREAAEDNADLRAYRSAKPTVDAQVASREFATLEQYRASSKEMSFEIILPKAVQKGTGSGCRTTSAEKALDVLERLKRPARVRPDAKSCAAPPRGESASATTA